MATSAEVIEEINSLLPEYRRLVYMVEEVPKPNDFTFILSQYFYAEGGAMRVRVIFNGYAREHWDISADNYFAALVRFKKKLLSEITSMRAEIS